MTMHLEGPWLNANGKRKGKQKFRNSAEAQKARQLDIEWKQLQIKWGVNADEKKRKQALRAEPLVYSLSTPIGRSNTHHIKSLDTGHSGPVSSKPAPKYTGTKMLGVGQLHKSNAVPVFCDQDAIDIARMRRG
jgi:hypothetical protein